MNKLLVLSLSAALLTFSHTSANHDHTHTLNLEGQSQNAPLPCGHTGEHKNVSCDGDNNPIGQQAFSLSQLSTQQKADYAEILNGIQMYSWSHRISHSLNRGYDRSFVNGVQDILEQAIEQSNFSSSEKIRIRTAAFALSSRVTEHLGNCKEKAHSSCEQCGLGGYQLAFWTVFKNCTKNSVQSNTTNDAESRTESLSE